MSNGINSALPVIAIMGPTASGKTGLALDIATKVESEVISVDSALVYKGMDIGTAKPTQEEQAAHLIDIIDPAQSYLQFVNDTNALIGDILARGKVPILAGGTMMYFNALINGISPHLSQMKRYGTK